MWVYDSQFDTQTLCIYTWSPLGDLISLGVQPVVSAHVVDELSDCQFKQILS